AGAGRGRADRGDRAVARKGQMMGGHVGLARNLATAATLTVLLGGCLADGLSSLNPFSRPEEILPGERQAVMAMAAEQAEGSPAIAAAAGTADWPQPGGNAANDPGHVSLAASSGAPAWSVRAVESSGKKDARGAAPPIIHGGRLYAYGAGGTVTALTTSGARAWSVSVAPEGERTRSSGGGLAAAGEAVFAATGFGDLVALNAATGQRLWSYKLGAGARSAPTAAAGKVFVVSATGVLHAVNVADGSQAWTLPGIPETAGVLSSASPAVAGGTVVVPYTSGEIIAVDAETGEMKWADAVVRSSRVLAVSTLTDVAASPVVHDGVVYATGVAGRTIAVRLSDGERLWEENIGSASTPVVSGNALFMIDLQDNLLALDRSTGKVFWRTPLPSVRKKRFFSVWTGPTLAGGRLWAVANNGQLIGADPASGQIAVQRTLPKPALIKPVAASGRLYVQLQDGTVSALQ
ncbi:MAG TPA: PQQ-binding-like beta-propeller repeat protein, partial [Afifellaceae bacterium]|nr:PQQ-binding-like beta-propeller repeat protein [Afifellaceae bacterium]